MISIPEQLSAARQTQLEAQLKFFNSLTSKAVANAEKIIALNVNLTRETVEKSSAALCQALTARDAADLLALSARTPDTIGSLLAYSRALLSIAAGGAVQQPAAEPQATPFAGQREVVAQIEHAALPAAPVAEPEVIAPSAFEAEASPQVSAKPIAKALAGSNGAARPAAAPLPDAASVDVQVTGILPVDATPPPAPSSGTPEVAQEAPASKGRRKK